jgi:GAF domain-containing protein
MLNEFQADILAVGSIEAVPTILDVVCRTTGMGFAAVARVTAERWIVCSVKDDIAFGLEPGGELKVETTICHEIRESREAVVINNVAEDRLYCGHPTPAMYGFQSYISMPIILPDGRFFGTLCAIDPRPARVQTPEVVGMFKLFAELIAFHLNAIEQVAMSEARLLDAQRTSELREQFIAVLGHDLRNPLAAISAGAELLLKAPLSDKALRTAGLIRRGAARMSSLIDDVMDFARGRLGSGVAAGLQRHRNVGADPEACNRRTASQFSGSIYRRLDCIRVPRCLRSEPHCSAFLKSTCERFDAWGCGDADSSKGCHGRKLL